jgi:hypothetical protein
MHFLFNAWDSVMVSVSAICKNSQPVGGAEEGVRRRVECGAARVSLVFRMLLMQPSFLLLDSRNVIPLSVTVLCCVPLMTIRCCPDTSTRRNCFLFSLLYFMHCIEERYVHVTDYYVRSSALYIP